MVMKKTIKVTTDVWDELWKLRIKLKVKTLNDVIKKLLEGNKNVRD